MSVQKEPINIRYYETECGLLINLNSRSYKSNEILINDVPLEKTFHPSWFIINQNEILSIKVPSKRELLNERYELINKSLSSSGLPDIILKSDVETDSDGDWCGNHLGMQGLYNYRCDFGDLTYISIEYSLENLGKVLWKNFGDPSSFSYKMSSTGYYSGTDTPKTLDFESIYSDYKWADAVQVDDIQRALTPEIAWHLGPCSVSSQIAYRIIRHHVKTNIDPKWAVVTSDYDFCFTVKKRIRIIPHEIQYQAIDMFSRRKKPILKTETVKFDLVDIFSMTHSDSNYKGYIPVDGFKGNSLEDLGKNIDYYLTCLMEAINEPLVNCPTCNGTSVVNFEKIPTNEREKFKIEK